ncbi:cellulose synthase (UDP-forming) [Cupriavidus metallidurans]|jgi:cellulose synthase (UDP-forming)|uniref:UDP-forming cellulose synthase catalytic subunit n=1 Tax=Cupriavidus TaxID=106589 RepID=UPI0004936753|nr:UDP-forming cellulose synthase catalytic subunit [Cupriavidus metallidurans]KWW37574.1 Cellulose synthase catalytic subunit [UDP-forming] [Cupriavidus metallidurans]MDE4918686.1 UDP-forming cellulose synthase catalytic subunit [Cupriavidus metallidurans]
MSARRFSLSELFSGARDRVARALGVTRTANAGNWLLRLFFRPPRPGKRDIPAEWAAQVHRRAMTRLGIGKRQGTGTWMWRLFIRPPRPRFRLAADPRKQRSMAEPERDNWLRRWLDRVLEPVWNTTSRLHHQFLSILPRPDWNRVAYSLESLAAQVGRIPYVLPISMVIAAIATVVIGTTPLTLASQMLMFAVVWAILIVVRRIPGRLATITMIAVSMLMAVRYIWWRSTQTLQFATTTEAVIGYLLYAAECYTWLVLALSYLQTAWPLHRKPKPLPADSSLWPTVDVFIPTYNESLAVVQPTVYAARSMDWPPDKLRVYILDDGHRPAMREFAEAAGVGYITRDNNRHAKAGNINQALPRTSGDYIAIFDCDHIPTRSFLQMTMGEFLDDPKCALVQTPHHFFSPDPFERNFDTFRRVPNEGSLFYGLIQDGNDLWNATFFCGSCAVIKRAPLLEIGGIAVETVTEDSHTALKLHRRGYNSAYLRTVQAAGLATESLSSHIGQRIRWARGMAQIFRLDNPLLGKGLTLFQRLCYSNAMLHFFYGIPRLIFLTMPIAYLYFGLHVINTSALMIMAYVLPYLLIANVTNSRLQGRYRHSFWAEVYESVLAWYIVLPTTVAFINPRAGKFNVTAKGGQIADDYLDWTISKPYLVLLALNVAGLVFGVLRLLFWGTDEPATVLMNMGWATFNLIMLGAAVGVAREARQVRVSHRIPMRVPATLLLPDGRTIACKTENYSMGGLGMVLPIDVPLVEGAPVGVCLSRGSRTYHFPAMVTRNINRHLGVRMDDLSVEREAQLIQCTFGRADAWIDWLDDERVDAPLRSFKEVVEMGYQGLLRLYDAFVDAVELVTARRRSRLP